MCGVCVCVCVCVWSRMLNAQHETQSRCNVAFGSFCNIGFLTSSAIFGMELSLFKMACSTQSIVEKNDLCAIIKIIII